MPKLPIDILQSRIKSEMQICLSELKNYTFETSDPTFKKFPLTIAVTIRGIPGPVLKDGKVTHSFTHKFIMKITEEYPYHKPIVIWGSDIFHPNIMTPTEGGFVCIKLLDEWTFGSNLLVFIRGIETLLCNPNPGNAYVSDTCIEAAKYFAKYPYTPPAIVKDIGKAPKPKIVSEQKDEK
ncbi:MAG: ubiquitin-conjugating enzyme E2 [Candidatus Thermoplasmatota archaeon]